MPFAAYMSLALYHPRHGYYASGALRTGFRGHFLTSPENDPAYAGGVAGWGGGGRGLRARRAPPPGPEAPRCCWLSASVNVVRADL
jgi:hypothetical protein